MLIIVLKWPNFKLPLLQRRNRLCNRDASCGCCILRNLANQRGTADFFAVFQALPTFGRVEDQVDFAIFNLVDDMRAALRDLVDALDFYPLITQIICRAVGCAYGKASPNRLFDGRNDNGLVCVFNRNEQLPAHRWRHPRADL